MRYVSHRTFWGKIWLGKREHRGRVQKADFTQEIWGPKGSPLGKGQILNFYVLNWVVFHSSKIKVHFWDSWADETRRETVDAYEWNRTTLRTGESFRGKHVRKPCFRLWNKREKGHPEMRDSQADNCLGHEQHYKNEYDSRRGFVVHSDTKRPKVENMEWRPAIIKHRAQRRRSSRIAISPARDLWKHE